MYKKKFFNDSTFDTLCFVLNTKLNCHINPVLNEKRANRKEKIYFSAFKFD